MRRGCVVGLAALAAGCTGSGKMSVQQMQEKQMQKVLAAQQSQVRMIPDDQSRAAAMRQMALSAAYSKDAATADKLLADLKGHPSHDEVAAECAMQFEKNQQPKEARKLAKRITDPAIKAGTLAKLDTKPDEAADAKKPEP